MRKLAAAFVSSLLIAALFFVTSGHATVVLKLTEAQMTIRADGIVKGKVLSRVSKWGPKKRRIYTYTRINVASAIKGQPGKIVTIRQIGGVVGKIGMRVPGSARFKVGEKVLLFLEKARKGNHHYVMSMAAGKYRIVRHPDTGSEYVVKNPSRLAFAVWDKKGKFKIEHQRLTPHAVKLETFVKRLKYYLANPKKVKPLPRLKLTPSATRAIKKKLPRLRLKVPTVRRPALRDKKK